MIITKGSKKAEALLERLRQEGDLVDVYSHSFFERQPTRDEDSWAPFSREGMNEVEDLENDPDSGTYPKGHLLLIFLDDYKPEIHEELVSLYPPLGNVIRSDKHKPDFLILNLYTRQILCVGLGRKNRLFVIDAESNRLINAYGLISSSDDSEYMDRFKEHDCYEAVYELIFALYRLGNAMFRNDSQPCALDFVELALDSKPDENGNYYLRDYDDDLLDEDPYSREDLEMMRDEMVEYEAIEKESMKTINCFFPQCERGELNTGDY